MRHTRHQNYFANKDASLKYLLKQESNVWLTVISRHVWSSSTDCGSSCIQDGLQWAQILGDASRTGFQTVFKSLAKRDLIRPNYQHYISRLFKQLIGNKVFSVTGFRGDKYLSHYYAFCAKNQTGGFVLMVVNAAETRLRTEFKLTFRHKKSIVLKYMLTVCDGSICLNDKTLEAHAEITPIVKKKNFKRTISLSVPPQSVSFFEFPHANIGQCRFVEQDSDEVDSDEQKVDKRSSVTRFLRDLAIENLNHEKRNYDVILPRMKRQLGSKFKDFNLFKQLTPPPKLPPPKHGHLNNGKILLVNKPEKTKIPGIDDEPSSVEEQIFQSRENPELPRGEMYLFVGPDITSKDPDYDYVEFDQKQVKHTKPKKKAMKTYLDVESEGEDQLSGDEGIREKSMEVETIDTFADDFGGEFIRPASAKRKNSRVDDREISEITAAKSRAGYKRKSGQKQPKEDENTQYAVLVKELAPTVRQNQINRKKAEKKLSQMALGEEEMQHEDNAEEESDDYEYFNEEDDLFFSSDEHQNESSEKIKRNSPSANRIETTDKTENTRFIKAFEKLLKKIEKKVVENSENNNKHDTAVRTRRSIDSVHVPKRKTRKSVRTTETGKQISKAQPIDIKDIAVRSLNQLRRKRNSYDLEEISNAFYEVANEIEDEIEREPKVYIKQLKHFHIVPSTNQFNISAEFVVQPKTSEKDTTTVKATTEPDQDETEFTTTIITPIETSTIRVNVASVFEGIVQPFIDFYHQFVSNSKDLWKSLFDDANIEE